MNEEPANGVEEIQQLAQKREESRLAAFRNRLYLIRQNISRSKYHPTRTKIDNDGSPAWRKQQRKLTSA